MNEDPKGMEREEADHAPAWRRQYLPITAGSRKGFQGRAGTKAAYPSRNESLLKAPLCGKRHGDLAWSAECLGRPGFPARQDRIRRLAGRKSMKSRCYWAHAVKIPRQASLRPINPIMETRPVSGRNVAPNSIVHLDSLPYTC